MNSSLKKLYELSLAPARLIIGLMSGTSLDGLDVALCQFEGSGSATKTRILQFKTIAYPSAFKEELKSISFKEQVDLQKLCLLNAYIGTYHGELVLQCLADWGVPSENVDVIASHGQTIYHAPKTKHEQENWPDATLQIGDGDHLAVKTGLITISDFRQKHIAAGGEGAPLVVYGDYLIFSSPDENRILLNIGGIANFTYLPAGKQAAAVFSTDVGPGNTIMDQYVQFHFPGLAYDKDALMASAGQVNPELLGLLLNEDFFDLPFPKTTGPELFNLNYLHQALQKLHFQPGHEDILATLCEFTASTIAAAVQRSVHTLGQSVEIYGSGGGMHNPLLVKKLEQRLQKKINNTIELGVDPDAKEALLFALLANECITGGRLDFGSRPGLPSVLMGKISLPF
jgi:anhydro-N-acetylmuramic acid kinase